jgi:glycine/D-amino acid oxidase-like deaminating enzyme
VQHRPYWWDAAPRPDLGAPGELPTKTDAVVIGGGYTGVSAARALAQAGARVIVLERATLGAGASTRNGGFVLPGFKLDARALVRKLGAERAREMHHASRTAVRSVERFMEAEAPDCDYRKSGHLLLAAKPAHYADLEREAEVLDKVFRHETQLVPSGRLGEELAAGGYYGALVDPEGGGVNPARFFWALAASARRAGAMLLEDVEVLDVHNSAGRFRVRTSRGTVGAGHVVVATDGYTEGAVGALRRRVIPVGSYLIATAPLGTSVARALIPRDRVASDTRHLLSYFRIAADTRMLFGGRVAFGKARLQEIIRQLSSTMFTLFPRLLGTDIDYYWSGSVGVTMDQLPHAGVRDGIHYALGYNGHGVALAAYLGARIGHAVAGRGDLEPFSHLPFRAVPLYLGKPWFLPMVGAYYRMRDGVR